MSARDRKAVALVFEPMRERDLDEVLAIESVSYPSPWSRNSFVFDLRENPFSRATIARDEGGRLVGYTCCWHLENELRINNIAVHPARRGEGIGRLMLRRVLEEGRRAGCRLAALEVRPSNTVARALYESEGFVQIARRKEYYTREKEDALVLEVDLRTGTQAAGEEDR